MLKNLDAVSKYFNPFHVTGLFLYPLKTSENLCFFLFSGAWKATSGMKWVKNRLTFKVIKRSQIKLKALRT